MSQIKRKKSSVKKARSMNKLGAAQKLQRWLERNKEVNIPRLRNWMRTRAIPGLITNLINDVNLAEHCHCALNELAASVPKKPGRK